MNNTNLKIAIRRMFKDKTITLVNLVGLGMGIACAIILTSWVLCETSYDKFFKNSDKIYRITLEGYMNGEFVNSAQTIAGMGPEAKNNFPEIEQYARLVNNYKDCIIKTEGQETFRESGYAADSTVFDIFPYKAVSGNLSTALSLRDQIVIDQYLSNKCFGDKDAVGETITIDDHKYTVAAVMENAPSNTHLKFHFLISYINVDWIMRNPWGGDNCILFVKLNNANNIEAMESKLTELVYERAQLWKDLKIRFRLQPLHDIYLSTYKFDYASEKGSTKYIIIFSITAFLVLLIACINFTNLFIASSLKRRKAMGIKITNGAYKTQLLKETLLEVILFLVLSFGIAVALVKIIQPYFCTLAGKEITVNIFSLRFLALSVPIILMSLLLASFFPWLHVKRLSPVSILKTGNSQGRNKFGIQKVLMTGQFVIAIILIFNVIAVNKQLVFLQKKQLGFNKENIVYVYTDNKLQDVETRDRLKQKLLQNSNVTAVSYQSSLPTIWSNGNPLSKNPDFKELMSTEEVFIDKDYFALMQIDFVEGKNIFAQDGYDKKNCIINQMAAEKLGLKPPYIDQMVYEGENKPLIIKGVIKNANTKSLVQSVDPCIYRASEHKDKNGVVLVKTTGNNKEAISTLRTLCLEINPDVPFEYHFLDDVYGKLYKSEATARIIMLLFAAIAMIIISLGLLAMVLFITESRIKEIGVRKVNGAKISEILTLLNKDFVKWVVIAFIIATPIAWYAMHKWLENFAYKTTLSWWIFALAGVLALGIALLTVSWQSWKAATRNPVEALRYE